LHQNVERFAVLFHRTPQILQPATDVEKGRRRDASGIDSRVSLTGLGFSRHRN
jgi:hypothetical protein